MPGFLSSAAASILIAFGFLVLFAGIATLFFLGVLGGSLFVLGLLMIIGGYYLRSRTRRAGTLATSGKTLFQQVTYAAPPPQSGGAAPGGPAYGTSPPPAKPSSPSQDPFKR